MSSSQNEHSVETTIQKITEAFLEGQMDTTTGSIVYEADLEKSVESDSEEVVSSEPSYPGQLPSQASVPDDPASPACSTRPDPTLPSEQLSEEDLDSQDFALAPEPSYSYNIRNLS